MIAIALAASPKLLIADEPSTALDVTVQAQILDLLRGLQRQSGLTMILITHDLGVIAEIADRVMVLYAGRVAETAPVRTIFDAPAHPYTQVLLDSIPDIAARRERLATIPGTVPDALNMPPGCRFAPRCQYRQAPCEQAPPALRPLAADHHAACLRAFGELAMPGVSDGLLIEARGVRKHFPMRTGGFGAARARARGRRRRSRHPQGRDARSRRRKRLRQVDAWPAVPAADRADRRRDPAQGHRPHQPAPRRAPGAAARSADHLPGPVRLAQSAQDGGRDHRRGLCHPRPRRSRRTGAVGGRDARPRRAAARRRAALPARVLRRPAPAHRHRPRAGAEAGVRRVRRGGVRAGRVGAVADHQPDAGPAAASWA